MCYVRDIRIGPAHAGLAASLKKSLVPVAERLAVTSAAPLTASLCQSRARHATQIYYVRAVATATDFDRRSAAAAELSRSLKVRSAILLIRRRAYENGATPNSRR